MANQQYVALPQVCACCSDPGHRIASLSRLLLLALAATVMATAFGSVSAQAAFVTLKEAEVDAIYSQASFGATPVDIRYLPTVSHQDASLLNINTSAKLNTLFALFNSATVHHAYYVDTLDWCGSFNTGIVGCGDEPGDDYVVESVYASSSNGAELLAHELAHNFNLEHHPIPYNDNLMDPIIGNAPGPPQTTTLTVAQANTILGQPSIQIDGAGLFIEVQPVLIYAAIPEPSTLLIGSVLLAVVACKGRRRRL